MNRNILNMILGIAVGAGVGSAVTYRIMKTKHDEIIQEEIKSVRESFSGVNRTKKEQTQETPEFTKEDVKDAKEIIDNNRYAMESNDIDEDEEPNEPYVISPAEFGDCDYVSVSLWYYRDGVVTNDDGKIITNVEELIGDDFAEHYGEYEDDPDTVYVRNDEQGVDYQVLADYRNYSDID